MFLLFLIFTAQACNPATHTALFYSNETLFKDMYEGDPLTCTPANSTGLVNIIPTCNVEGNMIWINPNWTDQLRALCRLQNAADERGEVLGADRIARGELLVRECCGTVWSPGIIAATVVLAVMSVVAAGTAAMICMMSKKGFNMA
jgi:hypothetical protein